MKYIIDIPKEYESDWVNKSPRLGFELCFPINETATNKKYHIPTGLKLESYTEPDRKAIENEVWEFARHLINVSPSVTEDIYWSINGGKGIGVAAEMTYQEAKSKYEAWKDQKEIRVGDVVEINGTSITGVVTKLEKTKVAVITDDGCACYYSSDSIHKTGSHCPEIEELLKKLRGES